MNRLILLGAVLCTFSSLFAQAPQFSAYSPTSNDFRTFERIVTPTTATFYSLDEVVAKNYLHSAPDQAEFLAGGISDYILILPDPTGEAARFKIVSYDMMEPELNRKFPEIVNLLGIDLDEPTRKIRLDWTYTGLHASVTGDENGPWYVEPLFKGQKDRYQVYYTRDYPLDPRQEARECHVEDVEGLVPEQEMGEAKLLGDCIFRSYRLAVACTGEYYQFHGTTDGQVLSAINTTIARVNQVMEQDMAVRLILVANNDILLEDDPTTDGYDNDDATVLIEQSHTSITAELGTNNFDIGHTFSTGAGGRATLPSICSSSSKGRGVTGRSTPVGDPFDIDFVAHELGHQFGGRHTFNSTESSCGTRSSVAAYEPGSGSTIQAYAGICGATANVQSNSDAYYHIKSLEEFEAVIGSNAGCEAIVAGVSNNAPVVDAGPSYTIPQGTPFVLSPASASDPDGDALTYTWEQYNLGAVEPGIPSGNSAGPLFRSLPPSSSSVRVIDGTNTWETLPLTDFTIQMNLTVRDVNMAFGCTVMDFMTLTVDDTGPFAVLSPNGGETYGSGTTQTITWDVAGTGDGTPVDCENVDIDISFDGGVTYSNFLANTPNDGTQSVTIPALPVSQTQARIRISCTDNIFYDFSDANFSIVRQEYTITAVEDEVTVCEGETDASGFSFSLASQSGYTGSVTYTPSGLPGGVTATFNPVAPVVLAAGGSQTVDLTLGNTGGLAAGSYAFRISATDGAVVRETTDMTLVVGLGGLILNSPEDGSTSEIFEEGGVDKVDLVANIFFPAVTQSYEMFIEGIGTLSFGNVTGPGNGTLTGTISGVSHLEQFTYYIIAGNGDQTCPITITAIDPALPVEWLDFTATARDNQSFLAWNVIQDGQGLDYTVEKRASNERDFKVAMTLEDSRVSGPANYQVIDADVRAGETYFYRVRQQDYDGAISYSPIRSVTFAGRQGSGATLVPNPASGSTSIITYQFNTATEYVLFDALGRQVKAGTLTGSRTNLNLADLPTAVYQVVLYGNNSREIMRLVKQ